MEVNITRTTPIYRSQDDHGVFVQWDISNPTVNAITNVKLERSGSPEGPFETVVEGSFLSFHFYDNLRGVPAPPVGAVRENINFLSLSRAVYYRVTVTDSAGASATVTRLVEANLPRKQALLKRKILRDERIGFKFNGIDLAVLKRRHWGVRCRTCFDLLTKRVTKSKCPVCFGTSFEGGYLTPVRIRGRTGVMNVQTQMTPQGNSDTSKKRFVILCDPAVEAYDIICDVAQNKRYTVELVAHTELRSVPVHQELTVSELARDSAEYQLVIDYNAVPAIY